MCEHCDKLRSLITDNQKELATLFYKKKAETDLPAFAIALHLSLQDATKATLTAFQRDLEEFLKKTEKNNMAEDAMDILLELKNLNKLLNDMTVPVVDIYRKLYHRAARDRLLREGK